MPSGQRMELMLDAKTVQKRGKLAIGREQLFLLAAA